MCLDIISMVLRFEDYLTTFAVCFYCRFKVIHDCQPIYECCLQFRLDSLIFPGKFICIYVNEKNIFINLYYVNIYWILSNFNNFRWLKSLIDRFVKIVDSRVLT